MSDLFYDVIVIGAGGAGLMCAATAGQRGRKTLILDHAQEKRLAEKIRISGGGRCNFTNIYASPDNYLSENPHFCKSALKRYTQHDFIALVERYNIPYHEKTLGQLFCDRSAKDIISMLLSECDKGSVTLQAETNITKIDKEDDLFTLTTTKGLFTCSSLVIATGGLSIPKIGATGFGYEIAAQFGLNIIPTRAGLVPLTFDENTLSWSKELAGISLDASTHYQKTSFREGIVFTHKGISGPAILQISSYLPEGADVTLNLCPDDDIEALLKDDREKGVKQEAHNRLTDILPKRLAHMICPEGLKIAELSNKKIQDICERTNQWCITPTGTEGYRTAEVTLGGVDTDEISSKTFESKKVPGLYFIGEVLDVTGHLGGFNFQWAWSSGYCAGTYA